MPALPDPILNRALEKDLIATLKPGKVTVLLGPRRVGKSIFLQQVIQKIKEPFLFLNGEDFSVQELFSRRTVANFQNMLGRNNLLIIDEAHKIPGIGESLKLMVDEIDGLRVIATGSAAFDLQTNFGEPLTGRMREFRMLPLAQMEYSQTESLVQTRENLEDRLVYGCYPELIHCASNDEKAEYLRSLVNSYLLKDLWGEADLKYPNKLFDLLRNIAFQVGSEVSLDEISKRISLSKNTVERYLDLLSKVFVVFKLTGFAKNQRNEITKKSKWFFYDNGIRNALIANFKPLRGRNDEGALWENYMIAERLKFQLYTRMHSNNFFWRTYQGHEIDWIEEREGSIFAYDFKWNPKAKIKIPRTWKESYPDSHIFKVSPENYLEFIMPPEAR